MIALEWHSPKPDIPDIDEIVKADIEHSLDGIDKPSDLLFHTVFLVDSDGPVVHVWGVEGDDDYYHCEYDATPKWVTLDMNEESDDAGQE